MKKYPSSLEEDYKILENDRKRNEGKKLGKIKENCIAYRSTEKVLLMYLKDYAVKVLELGEMTLENAK